MGRRGGAARTGGRAARHTVTRTPRTTPRATRGRRPTSVVCRGLPLAAGLLAACAHLPPPPPAVDCAVVEAQVAAATEAWAGRPVAGTVALTGRRGIVRQRADAALLLSPPDRLHAELLDPLGTAQAVAIVDGDTTATWTADTGWQRDTTIGPIPATLLAYLPRLLLGLPAPEATCIPGEAPPLLVWTEIAEYRWDVRRGSLAEARLAGATVRYRPQEPTRERSDPRAPPQPPNLDITLGDGATLAVRWRTIQLAPDLDPTLFTIPSIPHVEVP